MSSPEGVKKLYLAILSTGECAFPSLGEAVLYTPVQGQQQVTVQILGAWWAISDLPGPSLCPLHVPCRGLDCHI